jgi:tetratricopeptide (TPR) repeat protein
MAPVRVRKESKAPAKKPVKTYTPEMLVEQGNIALNNCELELAANFFERALSMSPNDTNIMDSLAIICVQMGDTEKALELLLTSTKQAPNANAYKWCYLGQLRCGMEAVSCYRTVIQLLTAQLATETQVITIEQDHC